jgi:uncharacterized iron-regulated membrane protein
MQMQIILNYEEHPVSAVPGSLFRKILFWSHLSCGIAAGLIILLMSATGVLLTYERQMLDSAARNNHVEAAPGATRLSADQLAAKAREHGEPGARLNLVFDAEPAAPVTVSAGRETVALLDPYTGAALVDGSQGSREFFQTVTRLHRYIGGDARSTRASLIDIANLLFVFIIASGIYLWLPAVWRWRTLSGLMLFKAKYVNAKVRDFNWHHVFSFWALIPLFLIAVSGVVMSYPWANKLVFAAYGEQPPQRGGQPAGGGGQAGGGAATEAAAAMPMASLQRLLDTAIAEEGNWRRITLPAQLRGDHADVQVELKSSERRAPRRTLELSTADGSVISAPPVPAAATQSPGQRARSWFRFVHTGEQYGIVGQTIAGLASLAACLLVYTGLALAWRRLIVPLYRRSA